MHICLICTEIFAFGKYGGFGRATRIIGRELVKRGILVSAVVPKREQQKEIEIIDGIQVYGVPRKKLLSPKIYKQIDADIYHSQEPSFGTFLAKIAQPHKKHIVTFRDPRSLKDWIHEFKNPSLNKIQVIANYIYENNILVSYSVRNANVKLGASLDITKRAQFKYKLSKLPIFIPTPVEIGKVIKKSQKATICFISRWDKRKKPELFFELAKDFPDLNFIAIGKSRNSNWDSYLRQKYEKLPNLEMHGFIDQFADKGISDLLCKSWIYVNTSDREGLPNAFLEAAAYKCAILSTVNTDLFATKFGFEVKNGNYSQGLKILLYDNLWIEKGEKGYEYIKNTFELKKSIDKHMKIYKNLLLEI